MKKRKLASVLAATALSASLLVACGGNDDETKADETNETTQNENATENEDAVSSASISADPEVIAKALSAEGSWIVATTDDVTFEEAITVDGDFHDKDDENNDLYRKLALYTQDDDRNVLDEFTLTVPEMTVNSPNFRIQEGTVKGNIIVNAKGFELSGATVEGDVTFSSEEVKESAKLDEGTVTGEVKVAE